MFGRIKIPKLQPLNPDTNELTRRIVDTSEKLDLDPRLATIVGSSALVLYGIMPSMQFDEFTQDPLERPDDVDYAVTAELFSNIATQEATPGGVPAHYDKRHVDGLQHIIRATPNEQDPRLLRADIVTRFNGSMHTVEEYDRGFIAYHDEHDNLIPGTDLHILSLGRIASELSRRHKYDPKARADLHELHSHIRKQ